MDANITTNEKKVDFFISEKDKYVVVSFQGQIGRTFEQTLLECWKHISKTQADQIILNFHDVTQFDKHGLSAFVRFEKQVREKPAQLRICFVNHPLYKFLNDEGSGFLKLLAIFVDKQIRELS
ncbi:MAG: hypothetical protein HY072_01270 [Deltaproteobacteria bacterium]|nr:hypothetical protein [Deltaproteobacteria bacterium]